MKIADLEFESASCCGTCFAATVDLADGRTLAVTPRDDGLYNLTYYTAQGLDKRELGLTAEQVEDALPKT